MISNRRFLLLVASIFCLGSLPFLILQPNGISSAGLSAGFSAPIDHITHIMLLSLVGAGAALLNRNAPLLVPLACLLMMASSALMELNRDMYPHAALFIFGAILLFALSTSLMPNRLSLFAIAMSGSLGFQLGGFYMDRLPSIAAPVYFLIGCLLSMILIIAVAASFAAVIRAERNYFRVTRSLPRAA